MINILWIDDRPSDDFIKSALREGMSVKTRGTVDDGINELLTSSINYDAIILDAHCIKHNNDDVTDTGVESLGYALKELTANDIVLPWFVYATMGHKDENAIDIIVSAYEREYDSVNWYHKDNDMHKLFNKIRHVLHRSEFFMLKDQYADVIDGYENQDELIDIIEYTDDSRRFDASVFNLIRKEMEFIFEQCYEGGILSQPYDELGLTSASKYLCQYQLEGIVGYHIQQLIRSVTRICNEGSHNLQIDKDVDAGRAPYLVRSTVMDFLNIVYWANNNIPHTAESAEAMRNRVKEAMGKRKNYRY